MTKATLTRLPPTMTVLKPVPLVGIFRAAAFVTARKTPTDGDDIQASGGRSLHKLPLAAEFFEIMKVERREVYRLTVN
jgi:hypothetical protein